MPFASSTVITPSLPTRSIACAMRSPIVSSEFAEIVAICWISFLSDAAVELFLIDSTTTSTALSIPRFNSIGLAPAVTNLLPSLKIACASTVAVVVPSPATSAVLLATSRTICAPIFSSLSSRTISFATVTPSLVIVGAPNERSKTTLRPKGPRVTFTAPAKVSTPLRTFSRASEPKTILFDIYVPFYLLFIVQRFLRYHLHE